jgi:DNA-binding MarR family transcriptional regulator
VLKLTEAGEEIFQKSWGNVFESEKQILENFPHENREMLIDFLQKLNQAVESWQNSCQVE